MTSTNLQAAVRARVAAALSIPTYDHVPQDRPQPYAVVGDDVGQPADSKTRSAVAYSVTVHLYSSLRGLAQVKGWMDALRVDLHRRPITISGASATLPQFEFETSFIEPDGARGVIRFGLTVY
jgi:hypothetical protein